MVATITRCSDGQVFESYGLIYISHNRKSTPYISILYISVVRAHTGIRFFESVVSD